ncbi:uncharacterized protein LOC143540330 [Bidens hawaiensis]|uniref:uncharacterized protein LOC143540330 n=1 Tax=Bidens hawaiensis TaxID=980011 RepID=UPI0040496FA9
MVSIQDDSMVNLDDDVSDDDEDNEGDEDQDPSLIVQDSSLDNKKEKGMEIYVGKLDKNAVEEDLVNVFQQFGELKSTRIVRKPNSNKSKGFGFVRFASVDQANRALSELKDGVEVRGKRVVISASQDNDTLHLGNICKTWNKEQVLQQLKEYGIEHIEVLRLPEDPKMEGKNKGFAFLEFSTHSDAVEAFKRLKKPDVVFGRDISAKVEFAETPKPSMAEDLLQVNVVHLEGLTEDWTEEKVKDICKTYGEILKINVRPKSRNKRKDFGFVTFNSSESALACVEGINNTAIGVETKIKASIAKPQQKGGIHGKFKVEKQSENSNKKSQPKSSKMKGVVNTQQTNINKKRPLKNKQKGSLKRDGGSSKVGESSKMKGDNGSQHANRKRKASFEPKSNARDLGTPKKPKKGSQGPNSQSASKAGSNKRKVPGNEAREDRGNRNAQGKKPFKKQKGNMHGRERDNYRKPKGDAYPRRGPAEYRNSTRYTDPYAPKYAASASNAYHVDSDRRYKEMEPHAGYIEPAAYSRYAQPAVRTHGQHQTVYHSQSQSQLYPRYLDLPVVTQPHRGYIEAQPYRDYRPSAVVQVARGPYDSGHARVVRHDDRGSGGLTYAGGQPHPASQVPDHTSYYQAGGSYSGAYGSRGGYY